MESVRSRRAPRRRLLIGAVIVGLASLASVPAPELARSAEAGNAEAAALLRAARAARARGDLGAAAQTLAKVEQAHPIIRDHASVLRAAVLTEAGEPAQSVAVLLDALAADEASSLRPTMLRELGTARLQFGDEAGARAAWTSALEALPPRDRAQRPSLLIALAESDEREGRLAAAGERYRELWSQFPVTPEGARAAERLSALEASDALSERTAADWLARGERLYRAHHNAAALEAYERALEVGLTGKSQRRALRQRAHTLFRMRRYRTAVTAFADLPESPERDLWHARSLARSDRVPEAIEAFEELAASHRGEVATRATFLAGLLLAGRGFDDRAQRNFEVVARSRYGGLATSARWRLAWQEFQRGEFEAARRRLPKLRAREPDPLLALRWRYWHARALEELGRPEAQTAFAEIAARYPFTYYGWRSSFRVPEPVAAVVERPARRSFSQRGKTLPARVLARARILIAADYLDRAREELAPLKGSARGLAARIELAQLLRDTGDFYGAQRVVVDAHLDELARGPAPLLEELWWHAWPAAFDEEVAKASQQRIAAEPELVYAIMREESGYRPEVLSFSGAYGLMQIMPDTGERLARASGRLPFEAEDLLRPRVNVALGAWYLGELGARFPDRLSAAIASYNAGPEAVSSWLTAEPGQDDDVWVESIPYDQTRQYVKRVLRSLHAYRVLY